MPADERFDKLDGKVHHGERSEGPIQAKRFLQGILLTVVLIVLTLLWSATYD